MAENRNTPEPCGCRVNLVPREDKSQPPGAIVYCPTHAAAPCYRDEAHYLTKERDEAEAQNAALLAALEEIASEHDHLERDPAQHCTNLVRIARAAIAAATRTEESRAIAPERVYREIAPNVFEDITVTTNEEGS